MKPHQIIALSVRLFSIYIAVLVIRYSLSYYNYFTTDTEMITVVVYFSYIVFLLLLAIILWKFPFVISKSIYPVKEDETTHSWNKDEVYIAGFVILGVYFLYHAISDISYWTIYLININRYDKNYSAIGLHEKASMITTVIELVISLVLILGASGLKNILFRIRYGGIEKDAL